MAQMILVSSQKLTKYSTSERAKLTLPQHVERKIGRFFPPELQRVRKAQLIMFSEGPNEGRRRFAVTASLQKLGEERGNRDRVVLSESDWKPIVRELQLQEGDDVSIYLLSSTEWTYLIAVERAPEADRMDEVDGVDLVPVEAPTREEFDLNDPVQLRNQISPSLTTMTAPGGSSADGKKSLSDLAPLEAVFFDVDGTLCDSDPLHLYAFQVMLQEIGFNNGVPITEEFYCQNIAGKHNDDIAELLFPTDIPRGVKFVEDKEAMFRRLASEKLEAINGLYKVKKWVEDHGLKRAAVTNAPKPNAELMINKLGLSEFFDVVVIGSECEHAKPHPEPYLKALEMLKLSKDHTFIFEDSVSGISAGVAAGMPVVGLTTRNPEDLLMKANPTFLIKDYNDPKLWAALEELDKKGGSAENAA